MKVLVTGAAGFIGFHTAKALLERGDQVVGIDLMTDYYDVDLKKARLSVLEEFVGFSFYKTDISKQDDVFSVILEHQDIEYIIHL
ncbi:MAG TPA: NAD-dependent epimerase/dehydratase family protein, partial [Micavibrio sp.]|nr:NAD-dependent epimerase/dehydratase family protein [Micavibrio sp.]